MRNKRITYFSIGLILQLGILGLIVYWFTSVANKNTDVAIDEFSSRLPSFMQDATVVMITAAAVTVLSMLFYGAARNYTRNRVFRNLVLGLILINAIIVLWIILSLM